MGHIVYGGKTFALEPDEVSEARRAVMEVLRNPGACREMSVEDEAGNTHYLYLTVGIPIIVSDADAGS